MVAVPDLLRETEHTAEAGHERLWLLPRKWSVAASCPRALPHASVTGCCQETGCCASQSLIWPVQLFCFPREGVKDPLNSYSGKPVTAGCRWTKQLLFPERSVFSIKHLCKRSHKAWDPKRDSRAASDEENLFHLCSCSDHSNTHWWVSLVFS